MCPSREPIKHVTSKVTNESVVPGSDDGRVSGFLHCKVSDVVKSAYEGLPLLSDWPRKDDILLLLLIFDFIIFQEVIVF